VSAFLQRALVWIAIPGLFLAAPTWGSLWPHTTNYPLYLIVAFIALGMLGGLFAVAKWAIQAIRFVARAAGDPGCCQTVIESIRLRW
jgi:hypothetical protein